MLKSVRVVAAFVITLLLSAAIYKSCLAQEKSEYNGEINLDETTYTISGSDEAELCIHRKITAYNTGAKDYCMFGISESDFEKIKSFEGIIKNENGDTLKVLELDDGDRYCGFSGYALYNDVCSYLFSLSSSSYPYTAEYDYTIKLKSVFFWPDWVPQSQIPVDSSSYTLRVPDDFKFDYHSQGPMPEPSINKKGGKVEYKWAMSNVPAFEDDDCLIYPDQFLYRITFVPSKFKLGKYDFSGESWQILGADYNKMLENCFDICDEQKNILDSLEKENATPKKLIHALHETMAAKMRYVAIEIGIGGWKPSDSKETFARGYGDCKDLASMYASMLRSAGINANLAVLKTRSDGLISPDYPAINHFNHVILYVDNGTDTMWVDPTVQQCKAGDLPWQDENIYVLGVDDAGGHLIKTPCSTAEDNCISRTAEVEVDRKKSIAVSIEYRIRGNPRHGIQTLYLMGKLDVIKNMLKAPPYNLADKFSIDTIIYPENPNSESSFNLQVKGKVRNAMHSVGTQKYLDLSFLGTGSDCENLDYSERTFPEYHRYPLSYCDTIILHIPENSNIARMPADSSIENSEYGRLQIASAVKGDTAIISRTKSSFRYVIGPEEFTVYKEYRDALQKADDCYVALESIR